MADFTPMMKQYLETKEQYKDSILFFRLGDFYEMFFDDAITVTRELGITLTGKDCGQEERAPMCGVPFHAADTYIARLVAKGYKVAVCEQAEDPATAKGLVKREVVRIITPGTILDDALLETRQNNYMCAVYKSAENEAVTFCEASTGQMLTTEFFDDAGCDKLIDEMAKFTPVEVILNLEAYQSPKVKLFVEKTGASVELLNDVYFDKEFTYAGVKEHFGAKTDGISPMCVRSTGALLSYLVQTQHMKPQHITDIENYVSAQFMELDWTAQRNLELFENSHNKGVRGSLLWVLDQTVTRMGSRTVKGWLARPLLGCAKISSRLNAVSELVGDMQLREGIRDAMKNIYDIERLVGKVSLGTANPRDLVALKNSLACLPELKRLAKNLQSSVLKEQYNNIGTFDEIRDLIERGIKDEPPITVREGDIIKEGFSEELEELRSAKNGGADYIASLEADERERTGIKNLKIKFNKVFGYYIEVSKVNLDMVPEEYIRKQTVANAERYITPRLKEMEGIVLGASEKMIALEYSLFIKIKERIAQEIEGLEQTGRAIGILDAICSFATVAVKNNYCCPEIDASGDIYIRDGRHPVVEKMMKDTLFVPNDTVLDTNKNRLAIITGPNMAGKSTYMRQTALIAIMAQVGSFVPAAECRMGIIDKVFTRVGASDDLSSGQSTFMVEMSEVASILKDATSQSLLILDEIGRGTSTYDGLAIAWSVLEYCALKIKAKTLFATHYHELTDLENKTDGVVNYSIAVKKRGDEIIFLRKIINGGADQSYGVEVAKLAGVPDAVIKRAKDILKSFENGEEVQAKTRSRAKDEVEDTGQIGFGGMEAQKLVDEIKKIDANTLSPIEALNILFQISQKAKEIS